MSEAELLCVGSGDAFDQARAGTSLLYRGSSVVLLDCGFSAPRALWSLGLGANDLDAVYVSHQHGDHCLGLPPLLLWMRVAGRQRPLQILGGPGTRDWLLPLLEIAYPGSFSPNKCYPIELRELEPERRTSVQLLQFAVAATTHSVPNFAVRIWDRGRSIAYSGDGLPTPESLVLYAGVDLLVHECYGLDGHSPSHASVPTAMAAAIQCGAGGVALVHQRSDLRALIESAAREYLAMSGAPRLALWFPEQGDRIPL